MKTLAAEWVLLWSQVGPRGAHPSQAVECRRMFYAGARAMFSLVVQASALPEPLATVALTRFEAELDGFARDVTEGRA